MRLYWVSKWRHSTRASLCSGLTNGGAYYNFKNRKKYADIGNALYQHTISSFAQHLYTYFLIMAPTILIVGATGNTGRSVVETLATFRQTSNTLSACRILALTRFLNSPAAQELAKLPAVDVAEQNWVEVTADWLREHEVVRAFIAPHNQPNQFAEESTFHLATLKAGVQYVVRISTTAANVRPDCDAYYPRTHWAIEAMLSSPEFKDLQWTSLQPNVFSPLYLSTAAKLIKQYRKTGKQDTLRLMGSIDAPVGIIDPYDVWGPCSSPLVPRRPCCAQQRQICFEWARGYHWEPDC